MIKFKLLIVRTFAVCQLPPREVTIVNLVGIVLWATLDLLAPQHFICHVVDGVASDVRMAPGVGHILKSSHELVQGRVGVDKKRKVRVAQNAWRRLSSHVLQMGLVSALRTVLLLGTVVEDFNLKNATVGSDTIRASLSRGARISLDWVWRKLTS